ETILLRHDLEIEAESGKHRFDDYAAGSVQRRVNNPQRFRLANHSRVEDQRFEPAHISLVDILSDNRHFSLLLFRKRRERLGRDRVYFGDNSTGGWFDHLR